LRALGAHVDAVLIALCDQPMVREATVSALAAGWRARRPRILLPKFHGRRGHPIVLSAVGFSEIISLPADATLKAYTSSHASEMIEMEVDDDAIARDIDTPADYAAEQERRTACTRKIPV
jgi:molybdenum cofactor cytidylyltransferase